MTTSKENRSSLRRTLGVIAALSGLASGFLFLYHEAVASYRPDDVANTFGLYAYLGSIIFWCAFLVVHAIIRKK